MKMDIEWIVNRGWRGRKCADLSGALDWISVTQLHSVRLNESLLHCPHLGATLVTLMVAPFLSLTLPVDISTISCAKVRLSSKMTS